MLLVRDDEVESTFLLVAAVTGGRSVEADGDAEVAGDHDVIVVDWVVVVGELAGQTLPLPVRHDALGQRFFDGVAASFGGIAVEVRGVVSKVQRQGVDNTIELIAHGAGLELINDVVVAEVIMGSETALDHVLDEAEGFEVDLAGTRSWGRDGMVGLLLDFLGKPLVASELGLLALGVDLTRFPDGPGHHAEASSTPDDTGLVDEIFFGEKASDNSGAKPEKKREEHTAHGEPDEKRDGNTDKSNDKSQDCRNASDGNETGTGEEKTQCSSAQGW